MGSSDLLLGFSKSGNALVRRPSYSGWSSELPTTMICSREGQDAATASTLARFSGSVIAILDPEMLIRYSTSREVSSVVPGTVTNLPRMQPSMISHHSTSRGSMMNRRSPGSRPSPVSALAARLDRSPSSRKVTLRGLPSGLTHSIASLLGSSAHLSNTSYAQLKRSGALRLKLLYVSW